MLKFWLLAGALGGFLIALVSVLNALPLLGFAISSEAWSVLGIVHAIAWFGVAGAFFALFGRTKRG